MVNRFRLGLIINPYAGIGGAVAMKGSDGPEVRAEALSLGATCKSHLRAEQALSILLPYTDQIVIVTAAANMGATLAQTMGFQTEVIYAPAKRQTEAQDTEMAAAILLSQSLDLLVFAGGDGTARNVCNVVNDKLPVLGIPAGCKIHSGVYGVTPQASGRVIEKMLTGNLVSLTDADVMDIDESLFRQGTVKAKAYGEMQVPQDLSYIQAVKSGGREADELVLSDIADYVIEQLEDHQAIMGSGSTVDAIMQTLGLQNTLLGVDVVRNDTLLASDVTAQQLIQWLENTPTKLVITLIGGQGHIFGRGNQQLSPLVISAIGKDNIMVVASKRKLQALNGRPLIVDTGDLALDAELSGTITVITGYDDKVLYRVESPGADKQ
jgi:predicted polyphosphate/ATP-dependent NAD kinase